MLFSMLDLTSEATCERPNKNEDSALSSHVEGQNRVPQDTARAACFVID